jgi:hypothetical protein
VLSERTGQADPHAVDRMHRLERELDEARVREKEKAEKAAARAAAPVEVVNIKGLGRIFKKSTTDKKDAAKATGGDDEDEEDDDEEDEDADPYASALAAKQKANEALAYTYDESSRAAVPLALLPGAGSKATLKRKAQEALGVSSGGGDDGGTKDDKPPNLPAATAAEKDANAPPPPPPEPELPPGLKQPPADYVIPNYSFGRGLLEERAAVPPATANAPLLPLPVAQPISAPAFPMAAPPNPFVHSLQQHVALQAQTAAYAIRSLPPPPPPPAPSFAHHPQPHAGMPLPPAPAAPGVSTDAVPLLPSSAPGQTEQPARPQAPAPSPPPSQQPPHQPVAPSHGHGARQQPQHHPHRPSKAEKFELDPMDPNADSAYEAWQDAQAGRERRKHRGPHAQPPPSETASAAAATSSITATAADAATAAPSTGGIKQATIKPSFVPTALLVRHRPAAAAPVARPRPSAAINAAPDVGDGPMPASAGSGGGTTRAAFVAAAAPSRPAPPPPPRAAVAAIAPPTGLPAPVAKSSTAAAYDEFLAGLEGLE